MLSSYNTRLHSSQSRSCVRHGYASSARRSTKHVHAQICTTACLQIEMQCSACLVWMIIANYHSDEVDVHYGHGKFLCIFIRLMVSDRVTVSVRIKVRICKVTIVSPCGLCHHYIHGGRAGWYLRQKPVGGIKAGGLPHPSLSLPSPFPFPVSFQTNQWEGRSDPVRGSSQASPLQIPPCGRVYKSRLCLSHN